MRPSTRLTRSENRLARAERRKVMSSGGDPGRLGMAPLETERENSNVGASRNPVAAAHKGFDSSGYLWQSAATLDIA